MAEAQTSILTSFLPALTQQISESVVEVTGEVENGLHQRLESTGDKKMQARQLNAVVKGSGKFMSKVHRAFEKNFVKFELYVRRNIVSVPDPLVDEVAQIREEMRKKNGQGGIGSHEEEVDTALLSKEEREERKVDTQLESLRRKLRDLTAKNQRLEMEQKALDRSTQHFQNLVTELAFLDDVSERTVLPLKRCAENISALREAFQQMEDIKRELESESREYKRSKVATRGTFQNLRKRFTAKTAKMTYRTTEELEELHSKVLTK
ncbi:hypothetical protein PsorP6_005596 [Peronosclerospora sorghi]|uniref:Uncharacterized protein n=1 Tax=Peronosclerospora sorghi TaxID=230839 RepID=A0ACC0W5C8_9STRA|nr:hypothetical protein PsorP6_005596 [Peronosclerospora sorghi]